MPMLQGQTMREKRRRPQSISDVMTKTVGRLKLHDKVNTHRIMDKWSEVIGQQIAEHSCPVRWQKNMLVICVEHPTWMQELAYLQPRILERIRFMMPELCIKGLKFEIGAIPEIYSRPNEEKIAVPLKNVSKDELEFIEKAAEQIPDPELRDIARNAMIRGFQTPPRNKV